jgi:3-phenylpropionate/trans-cinnamate dioxygenase ferredoxin subunit
MWTFAIKESGLRTGGVTRAYPKGIAVLLIRLEGAVHAVSSNCPHMGCSLGGAILTGTILTCPCHEWQFDITTGKFISAPEIGLETYPAKIENGDILINLRGETQ